MDIHISGHKLEVTPALRAAVEDKLKSLIKYDDKITHIDVILSVVREQQIATATAHIPHKVLIHAEAKTDDMYTSINALEQKLKEQIIKHHNKIVDHKKHCSDKRCDFDEFTG